MTLTPEQRERNARWANVARRTHDLHATTIVDAAMRSAILCDPLDAAETALNELDAAATHASQRAMETP